MAKTIEIKSQDNHLDSLKIQHETHAEAFGVDKNAAGYTAPRTPNANVKQLAGWWYKEYTSALLAKPWLRDPAQKTWEKNAQKVIKDTKDADPDAEYVDNHWFWNIALTKLAIFLESQKRKASPMHLFVEALGESASGRIDDAREFIENASEVASDTISAVSKVANAVSDASEAAWSGVKTVAIVGGSLVPASSLRTVSSAASRVAQVQARAAPPIAALGNSTEPAPGAMLPQLLQFYGHPTEL